MRRRLLVLAVIALAGCNRFSGPLETRRMDRPDLPGFTIEEQQKRGRERLAVTEDDYRIGPKGYIDRPSPIGR
jgi:hypothetical protein